MVSNWDYENIIIIDNQFGLIPNKLDMEGIERYQMHKKNHHFVFIDLEKSYDRVPREISRKSMMNKMVMITYIWTINNLYEGVSTSVRIHDIDMSIISIIIGFHQDWTLKFYIYNFVLDVLMKHISKLAPRCVIYAKNIILVGIWEKNILFWICGKINEIRLKMTTLQMRVGVIGIVKKDVKLGLGVWTCRK